MSDLFFVCGQVRALESKLLDVNRLDRMIGAKTPEDAFRVLVELQYSEYFDESTTVSDFQYILEQGLMETKSLLNDGAREHPGLQLLWKRFDLNNIKRALKLRFEEGASSIESFTEEDGFSRLGNLSQEVLQQVIFEKGSHPALDGAFASVLQNVEADYEKEGGRYIENALDMAYFRNCIGLVQELKDPFLGKLVQLLIDITNFRNFLRSSLVLKEEFSKGAWIEGGSFFVDKMNFENLDELKRLVSTSVFGEEVKEVGESDDADEEFLVHLERLLDRKYYNLLRSHSLGAISDIVVPLHYFEQRLKNARMLKFIMFAKFHGITPEEIYNTLRYI